MHKAVGRIECYRLSWLKCQSLLGNGFLDFFGSCLGCFSIRGNLSSDALASSLVLLAQLVVSTACGRIGGSSALGEACGLLLPRGSQHRNPLLHQ